MTTQLRIPSPCHEKWSEMAPVRHDCRHCATCDKQIVDFTMKTDLEILEHLRHNKGKICGRFRSGQLNRPLLGPYKTKNNRITAIAASLAIFIALQQPAEGQTVLPVATEKSPTYNCRIPLKEVSKTNSHARIISGKVSILWSQEPAVHCKVVIKGTKYNAFTDSEGFFSIQVPFEKLENLPLLLRVSQKGLVTEEVELPQRVRQEDISLLPIMIQKERKHEEIIFSGEVAF